MKADIKLWVLTGDKKVIYLIQSFYFLFDFIREIKNLKRLSKK